MFLYLLRLLYINSLENASKKCDFFPIFLLAHISCILEYRNPDFRHTNSVTNLNQEEFKMSKNDYNQNEKQNQKFQNSTNQSQNRSGNFSNSTSNNTNNSTNNSSKNSSQNSNQNNQRNNY